VTFDELNAFIEANCRDYRGILDTHLMRIAIQLYGDALAWEDILRLYARLVYVKPASPDLDPPKTRL
jgi:hypothetical protein